MIFIRNKSLWVYTLFFYVFIFLLSPHDVYGRSTFKENSIDKTISQTVNAPPPVERNKKKKRKLKQQRNQTIRKAQAKQSKQQIFKDQSEKANINQILFLLGISFFILGLIAFIIGGALVNLIIWIIGVTMMGLGLIFYFVSLYSNNASGIEKGFADFFFILISAVVVIGGVIMLIIGLASSVLFLWIGAIVLLAILAILLLLRFTLFQ